MLSAILKQKSGMHMVIAYVSMTFYALLFAHGRSISAKHISHVQPTALYHKKTISATAKTESYRWPHSKK